VPKEASPAERQRAIINAIIQHRPQLELAAVSRRDGFATFEMAQKWGGRLLSDTEKKQVDKEIQDYVKELFKSPLSKKGQELNNTYWKYENNGWRRIK